MREIFSWFNNRNFAVKPFSDKANVSIHLQNENTSYTLQVTLATDASNVWLCLCLCFCPHSTRIRIICTIAHIACVPNPAASLIVITAHYHVRGRNLGVRYKMIMTGELRTLNHNYRAENKMNGLPPIFRFTEATK